MSPSNRVALIMGIANPRSVAWSCAEAFAHRGWKVVLTCQNEKLLSKAQPLLKSHKNIVAGFKCDVLEDLKIPQEHMVDSSQVASHASSSSYPLSTFGQKLAEVLQDEPLSAVIHSLAHAPNLKATPLLHTSQEDYSLAHHVSAYSLIEIARQTIPFMDEDFDSPSRSITALSYLGAVRSMKGYNVMGPAKASLESIIRGLAAEVAPTVRVNAVSAGPMSTLSARGGIADFDQLRQEVEQRAPLGSISADQVATAIHFLSSDDASGITGQTIYVDGGYSVVGGPPLRESGYGDDS